MIDAAARGLFPPPDGTVLVVPGPPGPSQAVVAFSAYNVIAADVEETLVREQLPDGDVAAPMSVPFLSWLGDQLRSEPGMVDLMMVADPSSEPSPIELVARDDLRDHPRAARAAVYRTDVRFFGDREGRGLLTIGRGVAGRLEMSFEVEPPHRGSGLGRAIALAARAMSAEPVWASASPGNVASVRALLAAGYRPVAAECLFLKR